MRIGSLNFENAPTTTGNDLLGTPTDHGLPIGQGPDTPIVWTNAPTDGQILIGVSGSDPVLSTITAGTGISVSNGPGSIAISASSTGIGWSLITTSQILSLNRGYICIGGGDLSLALPTNGTLGDIIYIILDGSMGWTLTQGGGSMIAFGFQSTSAGGTLSSTQQGDSIYLVCQNANRWNAFSMVGNLLAT